MTSEAVMEFSIASTDVTMDTMPTEETDTEMSNITITTTETPYFKGGVYFHPHWRMQQQTIDSIPDIVHYSLGIYIGIVGIVGTVGNFLVVWMFSTTKSLRTPPNILVINLAISDLGFSAVNGFPLMTVASFQTKWQWGKIACDVYGYLSGIFGFNSIISLALISFDRYLAIGKPFFAMRFVNHKTSSLQICLSWFISSLLPLPPLLNIGFGSFIPEGFQTSCSFDYLSRDTKNIAFNYMIIVCGFFTPVVVCIVSYSCIIYEVSTQATTMRKMAHKMSAKSATNAKKRAQEIRTAKIAAATILLFVISWLPYAIIAQLGINGHRSLVTPYSCQIPVMFAKASAMWNPMVYAIKLPRFREALALKLPRCFSCLAPSLKRGQSYDAGSSIRSNGTTTKRAAPKKQPSVESDFFESDWDDMSNSEATSKNSSLQIQRKKLPVARDGANGDKTPKPLAGQQSKSLQQLNKGKTENEQKIASRTETSQKEDRRTTTAQRNNSDRRQTNKDDSKTCQTGNNDDMHANGTSERMTVEEVIPSRLEVIELKEINVGQEEENYI